MKGVKSTTLEKCDESGLLQSDQRGFHNNHFNVASREEVVMEHIRMFKVVELHYVRKDAKYEYLPENLNLATMHTMYLEWCNENDHHIENYNLCTCVQGKEGHL